MRKQSKRPAYQVGSLFAGMGGFCLAFAKEGFRVTWANEKDRFAVETYRHNFPKTAVYHKPIEEFSVVGDELPGIDVLTAGFPCQPFSVAGSKLGFDDERGRSFFEIMRLIREFGNDRPKLLLFENVPHLLSHDRGHTFNRIAHEIQAAGYWFMPRENGLRVAEVWKFEENYRNTKQIARLALEIAAMPYFHGGPDIVAPKSPAADGPLPSRAAVWSTDSPPKWIAGTQRVSRN